MCATSLCNHINLIYYVLHTPPNALAEEANTHKKLKTGIKSLIHKSLQKYDSKKSITVARQNLEIIEQIGFDDNTDMDNTILDNE